jgi:hypothetical protein
MEHLKAQDLALSQSFASSFYVSKDGGWLDVSNLRERCGEVQEVKRNGHGLTGTKPAFLIFDRFELTKLSSRNPTLREKIQLTVNLFGISHPPLASDN